MSLDLLNDKILIDEAISEEISLCEIANQIDDLYEASGEVSTATQYIAMESLTDTLKRVLMAIMNALRSLWTNIANFFDKTIGSTARMETTIAKLKEQRKKLKGTEKTDKSFKMGASWSNLSLWLSSTNAVAHVDNGGHLTSRLKDIESVLTNFWVDYSKDVVKTGKGLVEAFTKSKDKVVDANALSQALGFVIPDNVNSVYPNMNRLAVSLKGSEGVYYQGSQSLPGGQVVHLRNDIGFGTVVTETQLNAINDPIKAVAYWKDLQKVGYSLKPYDESVRGKLDSYQVKMFSLAEIDDILNHASRVCSMIKDYRAGVAKDLQNQINALEKAATYLIDNKDSESTQQVYKTALGFISAYGIWSTRIQVSLMRVSKTTVQTALTGVAESLKRTQ